MTQTIIPMIIDEEVLQTEEWKLGEYFVYHQLREKFGWTFGQFVDKCRNGTWDARYAS